MQREYTPDKLQQRLTNIYTGVGTAVQGNINAHRDFVGRDQINNFFGAPPPRTLYINVPSLPNNFIGRGELLESLAARLIAGESTALSAEGLPGVGKTTLAVALARHPSVLAHFSDGVLWAGLGPHANIPAIQTQWAAALGIDLMDVVDLYERRQQIDNAIGQRRLLLVIDDAWQMEAIQQLRSSGPYVTHLLTTRDRSIARSFAGISNVVKIPIMENESSYALLNALAPEACATDPLAAQALITTIGGLPLAIELLGGYLASPEYSLFPDLSEQSFAELADPYHRLQLATERLGHPGRAITLQAIIQLSLDGLNKIKSAAIDAFYALGAFAPKPATFTRSAAEVVTGADGRTLAILIAHNLLELVDNSSIDKDNNEIYLALHQTLADVARTKTLPDTHIRHRNYYLTTTVENYDNWQKIELIYPQVIQAWNWLQSHEQNNTAIIEFAAVFDMFQYRRGLREDQLQWLNQSLQLAQKIQDLKTCAWLTSRIGGVYVTLGQREQALDYLHQSLKLIDTIDDESAKNVILCNIGSAYAIFRESEQAFYYLEKALEFCKKAENRFGEASTLHRLAYTFDMIGNKRQALEIYCKVFQFYQQNNHDSELGYILNNMGLVHTDLGEHSYALKLYEQALTVMHKLGDKGGEATILTNMGRSYEDIEEYQKALQCLEQALTLHSDLKNYAMIATTWNNIGRVYSALKDYKLSLSYYNRATFQYRQVKDKFGEATSLGNIGLVYENLKELSKSLAFQQRSLALRIEIGDLWGESVSRYNIAAIHMRLQDWEKAEKELSRVVEIDEQVGHTDLERDRMFFMIARSKIQHS